MNDDVVNVQTGLILFKLPFILVGSILGSILIDSQPFPCVEHSQGGTLIFSYIRRLGPFFWVQNFNFDIFWGFQKNKYFLGYENFVDIFLGSSQNWTIFRGHFYAF